MQELKKYICKDLLTTIDEYVNGDKQYWKSQFNKCIDELRFDCFFFRLNVNYQGIDTCFISKIFITKKMSFTDLHILVERYTDDLFDELQTEYNIKDYNCHISVLNQDSDNKSYDNNITVISPLFF